MENLIVAALAVGRYSLQRALDLLPNLEKEGLADPEVVGALNEEQGVQRLGKEEAGNGAS